MIAWGGDGTLNEVASALAFQDVPLGLVPAGSGNGLARELGVNVRSRAGDRRRDSRAAPDHRPGTRWTIASLSTSPGFGLDAYVAAQFDKPGNRRRGFAGYAAITARALASYVPQTYTITTTEGRRVSRAILVTVANSAQFGNGARIAPRALLDDGLLDLVVVEERARWRTVCQRAAALRRNRGANPGLLDLPHSAGDHRIRPADGVSRGRGTGRGGHAAAGARPSGRAARRGAIDAVKAADCRNSKTMSCLRVS